MDALNHNSLKRATVHAQVHNMGVRGRLIQRIEAALCVQTALRCHVANLLDDLMCNHSHTLASDEKLTVP